MSKLDSMTIKECEAEIAENEARRVIIINEELEPARKKCERIYNRNKKVAERLAEIKISRKRTDWSYVLSIPEPESNKHYQYRQKMLYSVGLMNSGYYPDIMQTALRVALIKGDEKSYKTHLKGLKKLLPHVKPRNAEKVKEGRPYADVGEIDGFKCIDIFDRGLSEYESWTFMVNEEKKIYKIVPQRRSHSKSGTFDNLEDALKYIQENLWYESTLPEDKYEEEKNW